MTEILLESPPAVLSTTEQAARDRCETVIARGMAQFLAVGEALSEMRDSKLYRSTHATFADYCRERWDLGRARAYQLMDAAEVAGSLSTNVDIPPATEAQLRALKSVPADDRAGVWQDAQATSGAAQPSARIIAALTPEARDTSEPWFAARKSASHPTAHHWRVRPTTAGRYTSACGIEADTLIAAPDASLCSVCAKHADRRTLVPAPFDARPAMLLRTTSRWAETDLGDLLPHLEAAGYTWESATRTPDGRWHHLISAYNRSLLRNERQRMRRERLLALLTPALPPLPEALRHAWTRWQDDDTGRIGMRHSSGYTLAGTDAAALEQQAAALARPLFELADHGWRVFYDPTVEGRADLHAYVANHEEFASIAAHSLERLALAAWRARYPEEMLPDMPDEVIDALYLAGWEWTGRTWRKGAESIGEIVNLNALRYELGLETRDPRPETRLACTRCGVPITNGHFDGQCGPCYRGQPSAYRPTMPEWNDATTRAAAMGLRISQMDDGSVGFTRTADNAVAGGAVDWPAALELLAHKEQAPAPAASTTPAPLAALAAKLTTPEAATSYRAIGMLLRASGVLPALPTRPKAPRSADISDQLAYMGKLEDYATAMERALKGETA